jgi:hypothetical protein
MTLDFCKFKRTVEKDFREQAKQKINQFES